MATYGFFKEYNYVPSCQTCHSPNSYALNPYGKDLQKAAKLGLGFKKVAQKDSDQDNKSNVAEIKARTNPGNRAPGSGHLANKLLAPYEAQMVFQHADNWSVKEAKLTDKIIEEDAREMGVKLEPNDQNLVYIPLKNKKPLAFILVYPFYLNKQLIRIQLSVDRKLNILSVRDLSGKLDKKMMKVLEGLKGTSYKTSILGNKDERKVRQAVKDAAVILFLSLRSKR